MSAVHMLSALSAKGARVWREGDNIRVAAPPGVLDADTLAGLRAHKPEILAFLGGARRDTDTLAIWRQGIEGVTASGELWDALRQASLSFLASTYARDALRLAWPEIELWGVWAGKAAVIPIRVDALGLVPVIALSVFRYRLVSIGTGEAVLKTERGARHTFRHALAPRPAVVWWQHTAAREPQPLTST